MSFTQSLRHVIEVLTRLKIPYVVVGSVAAANWGIARMTRDVDLVIVIEPETMDLLIQALKGDEYYIPEGLARSAAKGGSFSLLHPKAGGKVDIFVSSPDDTFTKSRLSRRELGTIFDTQAWVASAEDVVLAKLRWRLESRSEVQWRDCIEIAKIQELDTDYMNEWAETLEVKDDLKDLLDSL